MTRRVLFTALMICVTVLQLSCQKREITTAPPPFTDETYDYMLAVVLDMSGSFADKMQANNPIAYRFFMRVSENFFVERMGSDDQIVIAQLSADENTLLWQGKPSSLKKRFPTPEAFSQFLLENSSPSGSRVYSATADTLDYIMDMPGIGEHTRLLTIVLSDMSNEVPEDSREAKARLAQSLQQFSQLNGAIGLYWVDQQFIPEWKQHFRDAGIEHYRIECAIVDDPELPHFD